MTFTDRNVVSRMQIHLWNVSTVTKYDGSVCGHSMRGSVILYRRNLVRQFWTSNRAIQHGLTVNTTTVRTVVSYLRAVVVTTATMVPSNAVMLILRVVCLTKNYNHVLSR